MGDTRGRARIDRRPQPAQNNMTQLLMVGIATVTTLVVMAVIFWFMAATDPPPESAATAGSTAANAQKPNAERG